MRRQTAYRTGSREAEHARGRPRFPACLPAPDISRSLDPDPDPSIGPPTGGPAPLQGNMALVATGDRDVCSGARRHAALHRCFHCPKPQTLALVSPAAPP
ncbi:hypothetical protein BDA96_02G439500 [Sorghum bicolor]|uniref:Uncharacterized protein n=2 Tax=Sorghum bicolor TaxID=4558 RepID=A0A921RVQ0_SORBI|nr:hypothetical protein BDA96_02G439500 [Sorghum bicolor]OQU90482.1 hypothetical protein SORBI_3002G419550 [Sorghum bicolor]